MTSMEIKNQERQQLEEAMRAFLQRGGQVQQVEIQRRDETLSPKLRLQLDKARASAARKAKPD